MAMLQHSAIEEGIYPIQRSLRFRSSASAYLSRTPAAAGNTKTMTWSFWVKPSLASMKTLFGSALSGTQIEAIGFDNGFGYGSERFHFISLQGSTQLNLLTTRRFRDTSAWYHIVVVLDTTQATASNRAKIYVNGVQETAFDVATYPAQNYTFAYWNNANAQSISEMKPYYSGFSFDGYLAEANFIDGQALTPSSFGQTDAVTGVWVPKKYTGTYGTNGFYLDFKDNTSTTTIGYDKSGNSNNWTANNISLTAGATYDSMTDVPTLTSATAANYCTLNPLDYYRNSPIDGNLGFSLQQGSGGSTVGSTFGISSGKWYWETVCSSFGGSAAAYTYIGMSLPGDAISASFFGEREYIVHSTGTVASTYGTVAANGFSYVAGDVIQIAYDADAGKIWYGKNGTWSNSGVPSSGTNANVTGISGRTLCPSISAQIATAGWYTNGYVNFGQRPFSYTPPTGFVALNTFNLPDPTIKKPNQYMDATLYTGNGGTINVTNTAEFQPDLIWTKGRSNGGTNHLLTDSSRGNGVSLISNTTGADGTRGCTILSNGFSYTYPNEGGDGNYPGWTYVGWQWKKGATPGFDVVTYTGTGSARTVSHSLGVAPKMVIVKRRDTAGYGWIVGNANIGWGNVLYLNSTNASGAASTVFNSTAPSSSVLTLGTDTYVNASGGTYVAYLFAEIASFSKFGSYTGNGSADGPFVYCGFRPKFVLIKRYDVSGANWYIHDTSRDTYNLSNKNLNPDIYNAENTTAYADMDIVSNGFKLRVGHAETNGSYNYIYAAFAENPFKYSNAR